MGLITSGRDMAGLLRGGRGGCSKKRWFILPILRPHNGGESWRFSGDGQQRDVSSDKSAKARVRKTTARYAGATLLNDRLSSVRSGAFVQRGLIFGRPPLVDETVLSPCLDEGFRVTLAMKLSLKT